MTELEYYELNDWLKAKLKENLEIEVDYDNNYIGSYVKVKIKFDNEVISESKTLVEYNYID